MTLSIITINRNNAAGLQKTMQSVVTQTSDDFEYIVIDGASTDDSVSIIQAHAAQRPIVWVSERDKGIYNAMNKGIRMATGEYIMILNSGDWLILPNVIDQMNSAVRQVGCPDIMHSNIIKIWPNGKMLCDGHRCNTVTLLDFYLGTLNHGGTYIRRSLYERFGLMDETLKICSDWAWFLKAIPLGGATTRHADIDTIYFDMTGVSESGERSRQIIRSERQQVLARELPSAILADYDRYGDDLRRLRRLHRHRWAMRLFVLLDRIVFKLEKRSRRK